MGSGKNKRTQLAFPPLLQQNKGWRKSTHTKRGRSKVGNEPIPRGGGDGGEARWWSVGLTFHNFPPGEKGGGTEGGRRGPTDLTDVRGKEKGMKGGKESFPLPLLLRRPDEGKELEGGRERGPRRNWRRRADIVIAKKWEICLLPSTTEKKSPSKSDKKFATFFLPSFSVIPLPLD